MSKKVQMRFYQRKSPFKKFIMLVGGLLVLIFLFFFTFHLKEIELDESTYYTKEELMNYFNQDILDENTILFYLKVRDQKYEEIPFIQKLGIEMLSRNKVKIHIYEKPIVGCVAYMGEYIYFDKDGKVLEITSKRLENITLFTGIKFKAMSLHEALAVEDKEIFAKVLNVSQLIEQHEITIDKVAFDSQQNVTLYTKDIKVLLGKRTTYNEQIGELKNMLPKLKDKKGELDLKDFTPGQQQVIFREK